MAKSGVGKSVLLKILSEVNTPNTGNVNEKGRIPIFLEVIIGFHPELIKEKGKPKCAMYYK